MSKKVAAAYLDEVSKVASTVTVYFLDEQGLTGFMSTAKSSFGKKLSCSRGFDYVTFLSTDHEVVQKIQERARKKGLDFSGF
jgi:hypothetical protein